MNDLEWTGLLLIFLSDLLLRQAFPGLMFFALIKGLGGTDQSHIWVKDAAVNGTDLIV